MCSPSTRACVASIASRVGSLTALAPSSLSPSAFRERDADFVAVVERARLVAHDLVRLVAFARDHHRVAGLRFVDRAADRVAAVELDVGALVAVRDRARDRRAGPRCAGCPTSRSRGRRCAPRSRPSACACRDRGRRRSRTRRSGRRASSRARRSARSPARRACARSRRSRRCRTRRSAPCGPGRRAWTRGRARCSHRRCVVASTAALNAASALRTLKRPGRWMVTLVVARCGTSNRHPPGARRSRESRPALSLSIE